MPRNGSNPANNLTRRAMLLSSLGAAALPSLAKDGNVEIGVCGSIENFSKAEQYGFDYYEPAVAALSVLSNQAFSDFSKKVLASRLRCESFNSFIRTLQVVGPKVDREALTAYMNASLDRCRELGASTIVWGSAGSRNVPEGYSRDIAWEQIKTFLKYAGDIAGARNLIVAIEPLRKQESNIINTGAEALRLVHEVNHPHVKMIIDYYHLRVEKEDPSILRTAREAIVHLHFANPAGRRWPHSADEDPVYAQFFEMVKQVNYRGGLSIEGNGTFEADATASLEFFKKELS
jgi:D-psicose/D-tagatose/L-ribulose 3-epimerase